MKRPGLCLIYVLFVSAAVARQQPMVHEGVLDLSPYTWQQAGVVTLTGDWEFYWHRFYYPEDFKLGTAVDKRYVHVPSFWNDYVDTWYNNPEGFGFGTYRVIVNCPPGHRDLALKFLTVESACRVFVNGQLVFAAGHPDTSAGRTIPELKPVVLQVEPFQSRLDIVVQVSNFHNRVGGLWDDVRVGTSEGVRSTFIMDLSLELLVTGCLFISFIYYLILYTSFPRRYVLLFFSIVCFIMSVRTLVMGEMPLLYLTDFGWATARRIEYISLYLSVPSFALFSYHLFPEDFSRRVLFLVVPLTGLFVFLPLFGNYYYYTYPVRFYELAMLLVAFYALVVYIKAVVKRRYGSVLFLSGYCILLITVINDILYVNLLVTTVPLFYIGLLFFVITLSVLLSRQFSHNFSELEIANRKLSLANDELAVMNKAVEEKNSELKKINHELDSFVNRTSHGLRAPLHSVIGIARAVRTQDRTDAIRVFMAIQEKTLERMDRVINDIIDFSKNKRLRLDLNEIDFNILVQEAVEDHSFMMIHAEKIQKNVRIRQYEKFISDGRRISIIMNNLLSNAIKYSDTLKTRQEITIDVLVADGMASIEVSDNGVGIEEDRLSEIFTLFYRTSSSTSGSGLGLYIIKETVDRLNGYISISSKKSEGTNIKISIPDMGYEL